MEPRLIKADTEYRAALEQVDALMTALPGTAEGDALDLWVHLVEDYEETHFPIPLPDPVDAIRFRMDQQALRAVDLIPYFGSKSKVSEVLNRRRPLSLTMMRRLHEGLGIPAEVLLQDSGRCLPPDLPDVDWHAFPLAEVYRRRWFGDSVTSLSELRARAPELLGPLLAPFAASNRVEAHLRQHVRTGSTMDENALLCWKGRIWQQAQRQQVSEYYPEAVTLALIGDVAKLSLLDNGPTVAAELLAKAGVRLVVERGLPHTHLDGAALRVLGNPPIVALTLRHDRLDNFWFTLCHELAHVVLHLQSNEDASILDDLEATDDSDWELGANRAATEAMIPESVWVAWRSHGTPTEAGIRRFAATLRLHPAVVAGRYRRETGNYQVFSSLVGSGQVRMLFVQGSESESLQASRFV
jgi:HTH-type transcriptional regulator / antitoxin HigA